MNNFPQDSCKYQGSNTSLKAHTLLFPQREGLDLWREQVQEKYLLRTSCLRGSVGRGSAARARRDIYGTMRAGPEST